ncbi:hypothetical protein HELRODRAFT_130236, partial [Helobdella robusta]|uniref:Mitochondrial proton/calcium exchanger protein n=1 Tax=Helobdella robusta TaxID=6412 RepID=T1EHT4_HELRO
KPPLTTRIINELKHYYHGFRLLFIDVRVAIRLIWSVLNGKTLMRRERKQLVRTTADLFRLVPFLVFIIVPFAEFLLPVVLKFFPGMLPSTFQEEDKEQDKKRKRLKMKLEMAKFLQDTIEETALQRKDARGESVHEFVDFMSKIRTSGVQTSNEEILKFSKLFEDSLTLDNLTNAQLRAMCQILDITPVGPSYILRFQLEMKLRELEADDKMIQHEGLDGMAIWELQDACRQRGMRSFGVPEERLKSQLLQWLDLHLNMKIPTSLLLLSRTLYFPEHISTEDQLKATILALPETLTEEAKVKILEKTGDRVDNKSKLEVIKQEEMLIKMEKMEVEGVKEVIMIIRMMVVITTISKPGQEVLPDKAASLDHIGLSVCLCLHEIVAKEEIHTKDLEKLEQVLEMVVDSKSKLTAEVEELKNLKEEFTEYKENIDQLKGVIESSATMGETPLVGLEESKAAKRLTKKVEKMIAKLDSTVETLAAETQKKKQPTVEIVDDQAVLNKQKETMVTVSELIGALESLKKDPESQSKYEMITKILDEDQDGLISYQEVSRFMELLGGENLKIGPEKMADIVKTLRKERQVSEAKKLQKQQQQ